MMSFPKGVYFRSHSSTLKLGKNQFALVKFSTIDCVMCVISVSTSHNEHCYEKCLAAFPDE